MIWGVASWLRPVLFDCRHVEASAILLLPAIYFFSTYTVHYIYGLNNFHDLHGTAITLASWWLIALYVLGRLTVVLFRRWSYGWDLSLGACCDVDSLLLHLHVAPTKRNLMEAFMVMVRSFVGLCGVLQLAITNFDTQSDRQPRSAV